MDGRDPPTVEEVEEWLSGRRKTRPEPEPEVLPGNDINPDLAGAVEELLAKKRCQIVSLRGVPDETGYHCRTHNEPCTLREFREGYCRVSRPNLVTREDILEEFIRGVREGGNDDAETSAEAT